MSIINDALKRAQQRMKKSDPETPPENNTVQELTREHHPHPPKKAPQAKKSSSHKKKKVWYQTVSVLVVLFFFIIGILLTTLFFLMRRSAADTDPTAEIRREYMPQKKSRKFKPGELVLSGTSFVEDKKAALINGGIYEVGDIVEGYRITSIEIKEVQMENLRGDNVIVLRVK